MRITIRKKLITIQIITAFCVLVLASAVFVQNEIAQFRDNLVQQLSSTATLIGENAGSTLLFMDDQSASELLKSLRKRSPPWVREGVRVQLEPVRFYA